MLYPVFDTVEAVCDLHVPEWYRDAFTASLVLSMLYARLMIRRDERDYQSEMQGYNAIDIEEWQNDGVGEKEYRFDDKGNFIIKTDRKGLFNIKDDQSSDDDNRLIEIILITKPTKPAHLRRYVSAVAQSLLLVGAFTPLYLLWRYYRAQRRQSRFNESLDDYGSMAGGIWLVFGSGHRREIRSALDYAKFLGCVVCFAVAYYVVNSMLWA